MNLRYSSLVFSGILAMPARATDIHVYPGQHLQPAIDFASPGDNVLVHPGTYLSGNTIDFKGKTIRVASTDGPAVTFLSTTKKASVVLFHSQENEDSILEGFTITGGSGTLLGTFDIGGGGICCENNASPTIRHCRISGNSVNAVGVYNRFGGGIGAFSGSPLVEDSVIEFNFADLGGGAGTFSNDAHSVRLVRCLIRGNQATDGGGAYGVCRATDSTFRDNVATQNGGGGWIGWISNCSSDYCSSVTGSRFIGNTAVVGGGLFVAAAISDGPLRTIFQDNVASDHGGALAFSSSQVGSAGLIFVSECVFSGNQAPHGLVLSIDLTGSNTPFTLLQNSAIVNHGAGTLLESTVSLNRMSNCIVRNFGGPLLGGSGAYITNYSNIEGGAPGVGNIDVDPALVDATGGDCHLTFGSPMIDQPDLQVQSTALDLDGDPRKLGASTDLGADEFAPHLYLCGDPSPGGTLTATIVGPPVAAPALLFVGFATLSPGIPAGAYGTFALASPFIVVPLIPLPATGALALPGAIPPSAVPGTHVAIQAFTGSILTNPAVFDIW